MSVTPEEFCAAIRWLVAEAGITFHRRAHSYPGHTGLYIGYAHDEYGAPVSTADTPLAELIMQVLADGDDVRKEQS